MNKDFVPYEQAVELKELGFDEPCFGFWSSKDNYRRFINDSSTNEDLKNMFGNEAKKAPTAPLYQQAFRWLREKHGLLFWIEPSFKNQYQTDGYVYYVKNNGSYSIDYATYEQAELECLNKLIEIVKNK